MFSKYFKGNSFNMGALMRNLRLGETIEMVHLARVSAFDPRTQIKKAKSERGIL